MSDCIFCSIVKQKDKIICSKIENTVLYEDDIVIIVPALGMSTPNYLMVVSKKHVNGFAEFNNIDLEKLEILINKICAKYLEIYNIYPIIFEHGSLVNGRHPLSITHAHLHIVPLNLSQEIIKKLFYSLKLEKVNEMLFIQNMKYRDYWVYRNEKREYYISHSILDAPRSCFIKLIAEQNGFDSSYEWRDEINNRRSDVEETIKNFNKLNI